jgi:hypothetical protein
MVGDKKELASHRRQKLSKSLAASVTSEIGKTYIEYLNLLLDQKVNLLLQASGEEAVALRGEMRCIKHLLSVFEQGNTPFTDSI